MVVLAQPAITTQPQSQSVSLGANVTFSIRATGTAPLNYQWRFNGGEVSGAVTNALSLTNVLLSAAGEYLAVVSDASGLSSTSRVATLSVDPTFTKITSGGIVTDSGRFGGSSWADYDNDGFLDLLVSNYGGGGNFLYRNNRDGTFSRINASPIGTDPEHTIRSAWGDYDNDGFLDLVTLNGAANFTESNALYHNNGNGTFSRMAAGAVGVLASTLGNCHGGAWGDFNNDGLLDLLVADLSRNLVLYRNNPDGRFTKVVGDPLVNVGSQSVGCAWADFDNDGWSDVFVSGFGGANFLFRNDGHGAFNRITGRVPASDTASSDGCAWGDYDNDGYLDLFVTNPNSGGNRLYRNKGDGTFEKITSGAIVIDRKGSTGCAWGDYDNDGFLDLFVVNGFAGPQDNLLYRNNGDGTFTTITNGSPVNDAGNSYGCGWGDYDNDGFLDLFVANGLLGPAEKNFLYRNNGNGNHWIKVKCVGTVSNRAGLGAKVRLKAIIGGQARWQMRQIDGGDGTSGGSLEADFGLGDATIIETVRIEWPSGIVQELRDVVANQALTIQESVVDIFPAQTDVSLGSTLTLRVTNAPPDSTLQWRLNGVAIAGATNATLEFSSATTNLNGHYTIVLSNATGLIFPRPAVVRVFDRPIITSQPQSTNVLVGTNVTLSVTAFSPSPITYQWQFNGVDLPGQTNSTLALTNVQMAQDGLYTVVATDALRSVTSQPATLTVLIKPVIVQAPLSQSVVVGGSATFSVEITGNPAPFLYQWRQGSTILTNMVLAEKKAFFTLNNVQTSNGGQYRVVITNAALPALSLSATCTLTVLPDADGDGLPDAWETANGLNAAAAADALLDSDGDGQSNLAEYRSGTSPTNAASLLKLESLAHANGEATVRFNAVSNQTYTVEWCAQPGGVAWSKLADVVARPNNRTETVTDGSASAAARFYRVVTPRQP